MRVSKQLLTSFSVSVIGAAALTPVLLKLNFLHSFLVYSLVSQAENLFLLCALSIYALCSAYYAWRVDHKIWRATSGLAFYIVALQGFMVMGLISFALLWVIPMCLYQFSDKANASA